MVATGDLVSCTIFVSRGVTYEGRVTPWFSAIFYIKVNLTRLEPSPFPLRVYPTHKKIVKMNIRI